MPEKMKNVVLWYSHNTSAHYLSQESLLDETGFVQNSNSCNILSEDEENFLDVRKDLQTADGIQYWHFKDKDPLYDKNWEEGSADNQDLRYWIKQLEDKLNEEGQDETIDAIVVPLGMSLKETHTHARFIAELKKHFPDMKVIVHGSRLETLLEEGDRGRFFAWALDKDSAITNAHGKTILTRDAQDNVVAGNSKRYGLAKGVDMVTVNIRDRDRVNVLRDALGMERLPEKKQGFGR